MERDEIIELIACLFGVAGIGYGIGKHCYAAKIEKDLVATEYQVGFLQYANDKKNEMLRDIAKVSNDKELIKTINETIETEQRIIDKFCE